MRVGVITRRGSSYGLRLLNALHRSGRSAQIVVVIDGGSRYQWRLFRSVARRVGWREAVLLGVSRQWYALQDSRHTTWRGAPLVRQYAHLAAVVHTTSTLRDATTASRLRTAQLDLVLLGQSGIVPPSLLCVPRIGTLNAHPGLLPRYRGLDCHLWAMYRGDFPSVGSTLHFVDQGIDSGRIVRSTPHRWNQHDRRNDILRSLYEDCLDLLLDGVRAAESGLLTGVAQGPGTYHHVMPRRLLATVDARLHGFLETSRQRLSCS
jgi:folate-dependent phosphoribosylglycinamide formyltransferase PurN